MARNLRLFYLFRLLATSYLWVPVFFHFMVSRGLGFDQIFMLAAIYSGVVILIEIPTGAFADRIGRRESMMAGAASMVVSCLIAFWAHSFAMFVVAEVFAAISMALCSGADSAYLFDLLKSHGRGREYARREGTASAWHLFGMAGACAAGGLLGEVDLALPYITTAGIAGLAVVVAFLLPKEHRPAPVKTESVPMRDELSAYLKLMRRAVHEVLSSRRLAWTIAFSAVVFMLLKSTVYLYQPYLDSRGFGVAETGFVFAGVFAIAALVAVNVDRLRRGVGEPMLVWGLLAMLIVSFVLLNQFAGPWALMMLAVQATAKGLHSPLAKPILNREIKDSGFRATVHSIESIARRAATGVFVPIAGVFGLSNAIYLCGGAALGGFVVLALMLPRQSEEGRPFLLPAESRETPARAIVVASASAKKRR